MVVAEVPLGTQVGKYRITERLGKGGMGMVYAALDMHLRRRVALKLLGENVARESELLGRFLLEARAAARLNHPNVVTVHDVGQHGTAFFIVMELVEGGSAQSRLAARGAYPWTEATRIIADVCRGLQVAHAARLIHRDVKPANILLAADGTAKLADFGLIKAPDLAPGGFTRPGTTIGTPPFMSPEHCTGEPLDERTDLYSLGVTYFTLLVGQPPYDGRDPSLILYSHCSAPVPDPRQKLPELPEGCSRIIARAMAKARSERYGNAGEMLSDLLALSVSESAITLPATVPLAVASLLPVDNTPASPNPRHRLSWRVGLAVVLGCLLVAGAFFMARPTHSPTAGPLQLRSRPAPLLGHNGDVKAISQAGKHLVSAGTDATVRVWDLDSGALLHTLTHAGPLEAVAVSPDGRVIAAGGRQKLVTFWDAASGKNIGALPGIPGNVCVLAFAPSGKQLALASDSDLQLLDFEPPARLSPHAHLLKLVYMVRAIAFSRDGKKLAACTGDGTVHVWNLPSLQHTTAPEKYPGMLTAVALSADGNRVAFGSHHGVVHLWEPARDSGPAVYDDKAGKITTLTFAPRHDTLVYAGEWGGPLRLCDLATNKTTQVSSGVTVVNALCFSADGQTLAAGGSDGSVRLWDVVASK